MSGPAETSGGDGTHVHGAGVLAGGHVAEQLPAYLNGTLAPSEHGALLAHLRACAACRREAEEWAALAEAVRAEAGAAAPPGRAVARTAIAHARALGLRPGRSLLARGVGLYAQIAVGQLRVIPRAVWLLSSAAVAMALLLAFALPRAGTGGTLLALIVSGAGGVGAAFSCGLDAEPCPDLCLSFPVRPRAVLALRLAALFAFDAALGLAGSLALVSAHGLGLWAVSSLWLGPMLTLGGFSAALAAVWGSGAAASGALVLWAIGLFGGPPVAAAWHTSGPVLLAAGLLLTVALCWRPRLPRMAP